MWFPSNDVIAILELCTIEKVVKKDNKSFFFKILTKMKLNKLKTSRNIIIAKISIRKAAVKIFSIFWPERKIRFSSNFKKSRTF